jgi:hypothetical protein
MTVAGTDEAVRSLVHDLATSKYVLFVTDLRVERAPRKLQAKRLTTRATLTVCVPHVPSAPAGGPDPGVGGGIADGAMDELVTRQRWPAAVLGRIDAEVQAAGAVTLDRVTIGGRGFVVEGSVRDEGAVAEMARSLELHPGGSVGAVTFTTTRARGGGVKFTLRAGDAAGANGSPN